MTSPPSLLVPSNGNDVELKQYLSGKRALVESFIHSYFREPGRPPVLQEAMTYSLFAGGKRVRPILCLASYEACGGSPEQIVPYASALEFIHTYSLIHDDLPAMDNDDLRRGKPTNHKVYGEAVAILAGDALLTEAFTIMSDITFCPGMTAPRLLGALREIAVASGLMGMVAGQVQDILSENAEPDEETLRFIHGKKTAALISASVKLGPILSGTTGPVLHALTGYGDYIGLAFQIIDDILDVEGDTEELGKPVGSDEKISKMTYPRLYGTEKSREIAEELITSAVASLKDLDSRADPLREIAYYLIRRRS